MLEFVIFPFLDSKISKKRKILMAYVSIFLESKINKISFFGNMIPFYGSF